MVDRITKSITSEVSWFEKNNTGILVLANLVTILFFIFNDGSLGQVLWTYWLQSVIIGIFYVIRLLKLKPVLATVSDSESTKENISAALSNQLMAWPFTRYFLALFFIFHYGTFHLVYAVFLYVLSLKDVPLYSNDQFVGNVNLDLGHFSLVALAISGLIFAFHHLLSYKSEVKEHSGNLSSILPFKAYLRVIPMHVTIIMAPALSFIVGSKAWIIIIFMGLKTVVDVMLHVKKVSYGPKLPAKISAVAN